MANQTNPFVSGLNAWASAMDPADIAKGQLAGQSVANKSLEAQILQDRINARAGIRANMATPEEVQNFILMNESASPQASQAAAAAGRSEPILRNPNSSQRDVASAMYGMGQSANTENVRMWNDIAPPIPNVQFREDANGTPFAIVPDKNSPLGWKPQQFGAAAPPKIYIAPQGGVAWKQTPEGLMSVVDTITPPTKPLTIPQIQSATNQANRTTLGPDYVDAEHEIGKILGYVGPDNVYKPGAPTLNPGHLQSVLNSVNEKVAGGFQLLPAIRAALAEHGINQNNLETKEFEGAQQGWYNPSTDEEEQAPRILGGTAQKFGIPLPNYGGKFLTPKGADFYEPDYRPANWDVASSDIAGDKAKIRTDFRKDRGLVTVPLTAVSRLTNLGDDVIGATAKPISAKPFVTGQTVVTPGEFYVETVNGKKKFGIGTVDPKDGSVAIFWDKNTD